MAAKPSLSILIGSHLPPNVENVLSSFGEMLHQEFDLNLIINGISPQLPDTILQHYTIWDYAESVNKLPPLSNAPEILISLYISFKHSRSCQPDVLLHITKPQTYGAALFFAGKLTGTPFIARNGGDILNEYKRFKGAKRMYFFVRVTGMALCAFRFAAAIITIGPALTNELARRGFKTQKIFTIPQPIDKQRFFPTTDKQAAKKSLKLPPDKKVILFVGRLEKLSDLNLMPSIIEQVLTADQQFVFCFVGEPSSYANQLKQIGRDAVHIIGPVPHSQMPLYYRAADLLLHLSISEGSIPNTVLEALACKTPICVNHFGDIETVTDNVFKSSNQFADFILSRKWPVDPLPTQYEWDNLKRQYIVFFSNILCKTSSKLFI